MNFTVRTTYTKETIAALVAVSQYRNVKNRRLQRLLAKTLGVLLTAVGAAGVLLFLLDFLHHLRTGRGYTFERFSPVIGAGLLLWTGLMLLWERRRLQKHREKLTGAIWNSYPDKGQETVFRFTPEDFSYKTPVSEARYSYSVLGELFTDDAYYYLYLNNTYAYVLKHTDFTEGSPAAFGPFLTQVTGKPVRRASGADGKEAS